MQLCVGVVAVWVALAFIMAMRWAILRALRTWRRADPIPTTQTGRGVNWFYVGVLALSVVVPIASTVYAEGRSRGSRPHGLFMLGLFGAGLLLFALGQARSHAYHSRNVYWVPLIFVVLPLAIGLLLILNFAGNFSV